MGLEKQDSLRKLVKPVAPPKSAKSNLDMGFAALALGVVVVSAGGAMAAPSALSWVGSFSSPSVRPIETVVAGLDRDAAKTALAAEAFPDKHGRAFMSALADKFPEDHDRLLGNLADTALRGGDRNDLNLAVNKWLVDFGPRNLSAIGRTGAKGFDQVLTIASEALDFLEHAGDGGCTLRSLEKMVSDPKALTDMAAYGTKAYEFNMKTSRALIDLAAEGRNAPPPDTTMQPQDERAVQSAFFSMMRDPQILSLMEMATSGRGGQEEMASKVNICALGRTVVVKLKNLPAGTKSRLWANALQQAGMQGRLGRL